MVKKVAIFGGECKEIKSLVGYLKNINSDVDIYLIVKKQDNCDYCKITDNNLIQVRYDGNLDYLKFFFKSIEVDKIISIINVYNEEYEEYELKNTLKKNFEFGLDMLEGVSVSNNKDVINIIQKPNWSYDRAEVIYNSVEMALNYASDYYKKAFKINIENVKINYGNEFCKELKIEEII